MLKPLGLSVEIRPNIPDRTAGWLQNVTNGHEQAKGPLRDGRMIYPSKANQPCTPKEVIMIHLPKLALIAAALMASSALINVPAADAQTRSRRATVSNSEGTTVTATTSVTRQDSSVQRDRTVQTGAGYGYSTSREAGYNAETGTRYRDRGVTLNSGATASRSTSAGCADGSCSRSGTVTGPNGETAARDTVRYIDESGHYIKDSTVTGPEGEQASRNVARDGQGTKTTTLTSPAGEGRTRTRWIAVD